MSTTLYQLTWDSYKNNVCDGFTNLQQNEEFVDMTLAADGHLVKVHKNIFALASPYIKSLLQSTPNDHPIFFLSNISHDVLNYILTYVYTGEVSVEADKIQAFLRVAKELRLSGFFGMPIPKVGSKTCMTSNVNEQTHRVNNTRAYPQTGPEAMVTNNAILIDSVDATNPALTNIELLDTTVSAEQVNVVNVETDSNKQTSSIHTHNEWDMIPVEQMDNKQTGLYMTADGYQYKLELQQTNSTSMQLEDNWHNKAEVTTNIDYNDHFASFEDEFKKNISNESRLDSLPPKATTLQYTTSNRGSLQLILNRFMYYCHHQSNGGRKRRWRCIEYRSNYCPAFVDTDGEVITSRQFAHCHSFHDEKIRLKLKRNLVYNNLNFLIEKQNEISKKKLADK